MKTTKLTGRFERALVLATKLHRNQTRKGTGTPYISHLLAVCSLVLEDGGTENEAIAALLHDAAEDQGGGPTLKLIERNFGRQVAALVEGCSETFQTPKPPWKERKLAALKHLETAPPEVQRIKTADKLHNLRCTVRDLQKQGPSIWTKFNAGWEDQLWYHRKGLAILKIGGVTGLTQELAETVDCLAHLSCVKKQRKGGHP